MPRKRSDPNRPGWKAQLDVLKADIESMPPGPAREAAHQRAKQLEAAIEMEGWLKAPGSLASG